MRLNLPMNREGTRSRHDEDKIIRVGRSARFRSMYYRSEGSPMKLLRTLRGPGFC
jgi:hypothetical protein